MQHLFERVSYLRGLCDGLELSSDTKEGKILAEIVDILADFADAVGDLHDEQQEISDYVDSIEEDLSQMEDDFYEEEDEDDDEEDEFLEFTCPNCDEDIYLKEEEIYKDNSDILCPVCGKVIIHGEEKEEEPEDSEEVQS